MSRVKGYLPVDLHLHSTASDGSLSPAELIARAAHAGLAAVSLTDHDTLGGIDEALAAGRRCSIEVLPGVEISACCGKREVHLLGYDPLFPEKLSAALQELRRERYRRMEKMVSRLQELGFAITCAEAAAEAEPAAPGRLHLARLMVKRGYTPDLNSAFSLYLERGRSAFVPRRVFDPARALALLHDAGAVPVLAHPGEEGKGLLGELVRAGLRGVEVIHPSHDPAMAGYYRFRAEQMGLLVTGGSDYHGDGGGGSGKLGVHTVPYRCLTAIKEAERGAV